VPPELYQGLTCAQIGDEGDRVAQRVAELAGSEYEKGSTTLMGNRAIIVHWPTIWPRHKKPTSLDACEVPSSLSNRQRGIDAVGSPSSKEVNPKHYVVPQSG
jgi:hypothetical protein